MFDYFRFSLPRAVTEQLVEKLETMAHGALTENALEKLVELQARLLDAEPLSETWLYRWQS